MTFKEMQTDALDLLQEIQNHPQYSLVKLKGYLNRGNITFARKTKCIEGTVDITTVANQFEYDESDAAGLANLMIPYHVRYVDGTETGRQLKTWAGGFTNLPKTYSYGTPHYYWFRNVHAATVTAPTAYIGVRFGTWPIAGTSAKTIKIYGFMRPSILVSDGDKSEIQLEWHDAPVYYAVSRMYGMVGHLNKSWSNKAREYMGEFERMVGEANEFMINQSDEPIETEDVYYQMDNLDYN
jgi:hypothetical protein